MSTRKARTRVVPLTPGEMEVLEFERTPWRYAGAKNAAVLERFGLDEHRYYARVQSIIAKPAAEAYDPQLVHRLRRIRDQKKALRARPRRTA